MTQSHKICWRVLWVIVNQYDNLVLHFMECLQCEFLIMFQFKIDMFAVGYFNKRLLSYSTTYLKEEKNPFTESWLGSGNKQDDDNDSEDEGSGSGWHSSGHYPPDDEDAYPGSGGGFDYENYNREGSGFKKTHVTNVGNRPSPFDPYKPAKPHTPPNHNIPSGVPDQPPSAAAKETMSLSRAITIYMLPAFIMFLGSLA